jgi:hypothetical protein
MELIRVDYSRKISPKQYETVSVGGSLEFKPASDDIQKEFDANFLFLKLIVDAQLAQQEPSGGTFDSDAQAESEPDLGEEPEWVKQAKAQAEQVPDQDGYPPMAPAPTPAPPPAPVQDNPAPSAGAPADKDAPIYLGRAKVFRSNVKKSPRTNKVYAELRIGHDDLVAHMGEQYITAKIWEPEYVAVVGSLVRGKNEQTGEIQDAEVLLVNKGDFVDVWGHLSPWKSDPTKTDLAVQALKKSEVQ